MQVDYLVDDGKELTRKREKPIRIANKSADGWKVVDEYVSDELASGSEEAASSLLKVAVDQTKSSKELLL